MAKPKGRITAEALEVIHRLKAAGKSSRETAKTLRETLGIEVDQRTISRHAKANGSIPLSEPADYALGAEPEDDGQPFAVELDEVTALEAQVAKLQRELAGRLRPRDRAQLSGELRQTFASIRKAKAAKLEAEELQDADAAWMLAKIKRFDAMNRDAAEDDGELPEAARTATGG